MIQNSFASVYCVPLWNFRSQGIPIRGSLGCILFRSILLVTRSIFFRRPDCYFEGVLGEKLSECEKSTVSISNHFDVCNELARDNNQKMYLQMVINECCFNLCLSFSLCLTLSLFEFKKHTESILWLGRIHFIHCGTLLDLGKNHVTSCFKYGWQCF